MTTQADSADYRDSSEAGNYFFCKHDPAAAAGSGGAGIARKRRMERERLARRESREICPQWFGGLFDP